MSEPQQALQIGTILDSRYRIVSEGTIQDIGTTYKAYDVQHDRLAVVLLLDRRLGSDSEAVERLAAANQALSDQAQPALIPYEHVGRVEGQVYLARSHVEGQPLANLLTPSTPLELNAAVEIAIRLCEALAPVHRAGLIHGGLSPWSVLVGSDGQVALLDTGLLPALRPVFAPPGQPWGRLPYISPEQAAGENIHAASDVYVVGSLLYEMLSGCPLFHADDETTLALQHLRHEPPSLAALVSHVPPPLAQIVHKALAKEPAARYRNAGQLAHILRSQGGIQTGAQPAPGMSESTVSYRAPDGARVDDSPLPMPVSPPARRVEMIYDDGYWEDERAGVDWIMVGLIIAAIIAVLGLIPLWRTVYRRYSAPPLAPTPVSYRWPDGEPCPPLPSAASCADRTNAVAGLGIRRLLWYNSMLPRTLSAMATLPGRAGEKQPLRDERISCLGVQLTGLGDKL